MSALTASAELAALIGRKPAPDQAIVAGYMSGDIVTRKATSRTAPAKALRGRFTRARYQRSPDREKSIERRRTLAATWPMPPRMCGKLTTSQAAYAKIVADEVARNGDCRLTLDEIAARAGICRKTAKRAQDRLWNELQWITVESQPVPGRKHLPNIVRIVSKEWLLWIAMGQTSRRIGGHLHSLRGHECPATVNLSIPSALVQAERLQGAIQGIPGARSVRPNRPPVLPGHRIAGNSNPESSLEGPGLDIKVYALERLSHARGARHDIETRLCRVPWRQRRPRLADDCRWASR